MKRLYLHEEGYHKCKKTDNLLDNLFNLIILAHDDLGSELVFEELLKFMQESVLDNEK